MSAAHITEKLEVWDGTSLKAWHTAGRQTVAECYVEYPGGDGKIDGCNQSKDVAGANAQRLALCWNACRGIPSTVLEDIPGVVESTLPYHQLHAQRNELLAVLKKLKSAGGIWPDLVRTVDAAIAKAEGGAS